MTKADLVEKVAKEAEMTKKDAEQLVEIIFESITESLNRGEKIELVLAVFVSGNAILAKGEILKQALQLIFRPNALPTLNRAKNLKN
jgi:hypothetical protein